MNEKCNFCPLKNSEAVCPRWPTNHTRYCDWVDPSGPAYRSSGHDDIIKIAKQREVSFPPLIEQVKTFTESVVNFAASGFEVASEELQAERLAICKACENFVEGRCRLCGCNLNFKIKMKSGKCPDSPPRW